jgi:predicted dehydrogenase
MTAARVLPAALPAPRFPDPADAPPLRWGILAPGWIAGMWAETVLANTNQRIVAAGSRSAERAARFAAQHGIERSYGSYAQLVEDPEVDVVYVASPHSEHREQALLAIAAGKHVLVEKAFTRNAAEAAEVVAAARAAGVFVMEAMWTRYLPHTDVVRQLLDDRALGDVHLVTGDFGVLADPDPTHRLLNPELAGGVLLDLGIYPLAWAQLVAGHAGGAGATALAVEPASIQATGVLAPTGVDAQALVQLGWASGVQAQVFTTMLGATAQTGTVTGSRARLELGGEFFTPTSVTMVAGDERVTWDDNRITGHAGLCFQAAALARYVAEGRTESPLQPLDETVAVLRTADEVRRQLGVVFPGE